LQIPVLLYVPQATACLLARFVGLRPLATFYLVRLANLVCATALLVWAIGRLPGLRWWLAALALTPMALALRASASPDALGFAIACAWLAEIAAIRCSEKEPDRGARLRLLLLALGIGLSKPVYLPLLLLAFVGPRHQGRRSRFRLALGALVVGGLASVAHLATLEPVRLRWDVEMNHPEIQLQRLSESPWKTARVLATDLVVHAPRFLAQALGHELGWQDLPLPRPLILLVLLGLVLIAWLESHGPPRWTGRELGWIGAVALASAFLVELALWVQWTPPEIDGVEGVQGRYFLPLALLVTWLVCPALRRVPPLAMGGRHLAGAAIAVAFLSGVGTLVAVLTGYWL
jgi:uncharacterized membrane protein